MTDNIQLVLSQIQKDMLKRDDLAETNKLITGLTTRVEKAEVKASEAEKVATKAKETADDLLSKYDEILERLAQVEKFIPKATSRFTAEDVGDSINNAKKIVGLKNLVWYEGEDDNKLTVYDHVVHMLRSIGFKEMDVASDLIDTFTTTNGKKRKVIYLVFNTERSVELLVKYDWKLKMDGRGLSTTPWVPEGAYPTMKKLSDLEWALRGPNAAHDLVKLKEDGTRAPSGIKTKVRYMGNALVLEVRVANVKMNGRCFGADATVDKVVDALKEEMAIAERRVPKRKQRDEVIGLCQCVDDEGYCSGGEEGPADDGVRMYC